MVDLGRERIVLCRPQGGLNDILCQIEKACSYADRFDRKVIVETDFVNASTFKDAFSNYFVAKGRALVLSSSGVSDDFDGLSVVPSVLFGKVSNYSTYYDPDRGNHVDEESGVLLSFDMEEDYSENLLVHHACGWEKNTSLRALSRLKVKRGISKELSRRLALIGSSYSAIHIRDTDYKTSYRAKVLKMKKAIRGPVFVATDNREALEFCRSVFGHEQTFSFSKLPDQAGRPLHYFQDLSEAYIRNLDSLVDLLMLALSEHYYFFPIYGTSDKRAPMYSGFSMLAYELRRRPHVLRHLFVDSHDIALPGYVRATLTQFVNRSSEALAKFCKLNKRI